MKRALMVIALVLASAGCGGTTPTPTTDPTVNLSAAGKASYQATKVVKALDVLRDVAIAAEQQHAISTDTARKVVTYHRQTVQTIGAVPDGWKAVAQSGLDQLQKDVPPSDWAQLEPFVRLVQTLYQEVIQ